MLSGSSSLRPYKAGDATPRLGPQIEFESFKFGWSAKSRRGVHAIEGRSLMHPTGLTEKEFFRLGVPSGNSVSFFRR